MTSFTIGIYIGTLLGTIVTRIYVDIIKHDKKEK
jgi:hypothetical protein